MTSRIVALEAGTTSLICSFYFLVHVGDHNESAFIGSVSSSHALERLPEVIDDTDVIMELESAKSLRVDDALAESRKIRETLEQKPKQVRR